MLAYKFLAIPLLLSLVLVTPALARGNDFNFTDGMGEEIQIRNGLFGSKSKLVKDRLGNGFKQEKGWFGTKTTQASLMGNDFKTKKGILGGSDISGSTIFGDSIKTKKGIFGRRTTTVDLSGSGKMLQSFFGPKRSLQPVAPFNNGSIDTPVQIDSSLPSGGSPYNN